MKLQERYQLFEIIGKGGNSVVYRALDESLHIEVAIKCIAQAKEHAQKEARCMAKLSHSAIPHIYDAFEEQGIVYIVMEYLQGVSLMEYIQQRAVISQQQLYQWIAQVIDVMGYLHQQRLLYIDMKPQNLMLGKDHRLYVLDFGSVTAFHEPVESATRGYAPFEVIQEKRGVVQSDVYAFGRCFYVLYHGSFPTKEAQTKDGLDRFLLTCCQEDIALRFSDFAAVAKAFSLLQRNARRICKSLLFLGIAAVVCFLLGIYSLSKLSVAKQQAYLAAMRKESFEEALLYQPYALEPYKGLMEQGCLKASCSFGFQQVEALALENKAYRHSDIAFYLASQALLLEKEEGVFKAYNYFQYVEEQRKDEKEVIQAMKTILEMLQKDVHGQPLFQQLLQAEKHCAKLKDIQLRFAYQKLLVSLYQQERNHKEAPSKVLALCAIMRKELQEYDEHLAWKEREFLDESEAFAWYEIGYREYEKGNYEEMNKAYAKSVHFMKQISREDRYQRISDMLYSCFYYGVSDEHKASHVSLLQEALYYVQKIEIPEEKAYFLRKIKQEQEFWQ